MTRQGLPQGGFNGGVPIGTIATPYVSNRHTEHNTLLNAFGGEGSRVFLGMLKLWNQYNELPTPMLNMTELGNAIIYTPTMEADLEFAVPYKIGVPFIKAVMIDSLITKPGIANTFVPMVLSEEYTNNDILTNNFRNGFQVRVHPTRPVEPFETGDGFVHWVTPASDDPEAYIPREFLEPGVRWVKSDNRSGEKDENYSALSNIDRGGVMQLNHRTGNSLIGISHSITSYADFSDISTLSSANNKLGLFNYKGMSSADLNGIMNIYNVGPDGKTPTSEAKWMPIIINRMMRELAMMKEYSMTWSQSYSFIGQGGKRITVPKGYYQWIKQHGSYYTYSAFRELPNLLKNIVGQLFAGRKGLPLHERRVKFKMGIGAMQELQKAWMEQFKSDNPFLMINDGKNPLLADMLTGTSQNLSYKPIRITSVQFPEVGTIEIEHSPALDYIDDMEEVQAGTGYLPNSAYMIFVEDLTESSFSNLMPKGAVNNVSDTNNGTNVMQVKPKNFYDTISFIPGVGCNPTLKKFLGLNPNSQFAANKGRGFEVVMETTAEIFVKDPSRSILIEYVPNIF